ncbi:hypothetical protein AB0I28_12775 [Phytomonospora sp. NPDC050363]|uniref:hypothetical protein n=1 Tax=Phytomonospora sp. NPDC050363 TaxID=3155642 RepID=UPI0033FD392E
MDGLQATVNELSGVILDLMATREALTRHLAGDMLISLPLTSEGLVRVHSQLTEVRNEVRGFAAMDLLAGVRIDSPVPSALGGGGPG